MIDTCYQHAWHIHGGDLQSLENWELFWPFALDADSAGGVVPLALFLLVLPASQLADRDARISTRIECISIILFYLIDLV